MGLAVQEGTLPSINFNFLQQLARNPRFAGNSAMNLMEIRAGKDLRKADPTMLQIEVTSRCNFRCSYCIVHNGTETEKPGDMSVDLFRHVLDRFPSSYYLQLHGQGEPLLHPQLEEMVAIAEKQSRFSSLVSNGSLWTEKKSKALLSAGVDVISISLDLDSPEEMEADRIGLKYLDVIRTIGQLIRWRDEIRPLTAVGVSAVFKRSLIDHPELLKNHVKRLDDLGIDFLFVGPLAGTQSYRGRYPEQHLSEIIPPPDQRRLIPFATHCTVYETPATNFVRGRCMWPWMALYINFDGAVSYCSNNHRVRVGHVDDTDVINLELHRELRVKFSAGQIPKGCKGCQYLLALNGSYEQEEASSDLVTSIRPAGL
jgi:MoaA/NifB/PqqE/SkfB family radical SAM enzyme